jgi:predicted Zn-ribbon and HTH transcriptional regulator
MVKEISKEKLEELVEEGIKLRKELEKRMKKMSTPSVECPKCGHRFSDKRTMR